MIAGMGVGIVALGHAAQHGAIAAGVPGQAVLRPHGIGGGGAVGQEEVKG